MTAALRLLPARPAAPEAIAVTDLPEPLVPPDIDLRPFPSMNLDVARLRDSELAAAPDQVFRVSVLSWCVAWHQLPAGSLPDDDAALCRLLGFGRDMRGWKRARAAGCLRGWLLCSDGRLYHPVVAQKALEAWGWKETARKKRERDADRLRRWRNDRGGTEQEWEVIRQQVLTRDGRRCTACGSSHDLHCDHIIPAAQGGPTELANLTTLCRTCHARKTAEQGGGEMRSETHIIAERTERIGSDRIGSDRNRRDTTPPPSSGVSLAKPPATATATAALSRRVEGVDSDRVREALEGGDLLGMIAAFGAKVGGDREAEWKRDCDGLQLGVVAVILAWRRSEHSPIREPSGFRPWRDAWRELGRGEKDDLTELLKGYGIETPKAAP